MKIKVLMLVIIGAVFFINSGIAELVEKEAAQTASVVQQADVVAGPVLVENRICPVLKNAIPEYFMGKSTVEYNGKIYNLCCPGCKEAFLADPEKFVKIAEESVVKPAVIR